MRSEPRGKSGMGSARGGAVKCGKERQDAAVGAEIATVNSCGDQRGVSELRIGTNNRREGDCEKNYAGGVHGNRRGDLRGVSAQRIAREFASGICVRNLRQEIGTEVCRDGLSRWNYAVGLKREKAGTGTKKDREKIAVIRVELNFRAGVSAATPIGWAKRSSFFHRLQDPEFRLSRRRIRGTVCTANSRLFFRPRVYSGLPAPAPCFDPKRLPWFRPRVPTS